MHRPIQSLLLNLKLSFNEAVEMLMAPSKGRPAFFLKVYIFLSVCALISLISSWYIFDTMNSSDRLMGDAYLENLLFSILNDGPTDIILYALILPYFYRSNVRQNHIYSFQDFTRSIDVYAYVLYFAGSVFFIVLTMNIWEQFPGDEYIPLNLLDGVIPYTDSFFRELFDFAMTVLNWILLASLILFQSRDKLTLENLKKSWVYIVTAIIFLQAIVFIAALILENVSAFIIRPMAMLFVEPLIPTLLFIPILVLFYSGVLMVTSTFMQAAFRVEVDENRKLHDEGLDLLDDQSELRDYSASAGSDSLD